MIHSNKCILHCDKHIRIGSQKFHETVHILITKCDTLIFYILIHLVRCPLLAIKLITTLWDVTQCLKNTALCCGVLYLGRCSFSYTNYLFQMPQKSTSLYLYYNSLSEKLNRKMAPNLAYCIPASNFWLVKNVKYLHCQKMYFFGLL